MGADKLKRRHTVLQPHQFAAAITLLLGEEAGTVGHDEAEVARAGLIDPRVIDLVQDAVAEREPNAADRRQRGADAGFRAGCPAGRDAWPAGCVGHYRLLMRRRCRLCHETTERLNTDP